MLVKESVRVKVVDALRAVQERVGGISPPAADEQQAVVGRLAKSKTAADGWSQQVASDIADIMDQWVRAKSVHECVDTALESAKAAVVQAITPIFCEQLWARKSKPSNPVIELEIGGNIAHRYQVWMTSVFTTNFKKSTTETHTSMAYVQELVDAGLTVQAATDLVAQEFRIIHHQGVRPISDLLTGSYDKTGNWMDSSEIERRAAAKIDAWFHWTGGDPAPEPLSAAERLAAIVNKNVVVIRPGFLDRVHNYARDAKDIERIFTLIKPSIFPTRLDFALSDDDAAKKLKRIQYSVEILA